MIAGRLVAFLTLDASGLLGGLKNSGSALTAFGSQVTVAATGMKGLALAGTSSLIGVGREAVGLAADFESTTVAFESLTGSAKQARDTLAQLTDLANTTPFQFGDLTKATQRLMTYGFTAKEAVGLVTKLGDLAAAAPDGMAEGLNRVGLAIGQIRTKGKTSTQELNQLAEAGIPVREALAKRLGVDVAKAMDMVEKGAVDARAGILSVLDLANDPRFSGMMQRQSQTLNGLLSTMRDGWSMFLRDLGQQIIEAFDLKGMVRDQAALFDAMRSAVTTLRPMLDAVGSALKYIRDNLVDVVEAIGVGLLKGLAAVSEMIGRISAGLAGMKGLTGKFLFDNQTRQFLQSMAGELIFSANDLRGVGGVGAIQDFAKSWREKMAQNAKPAAALAKDPQMEKLLQFEGLQTAKPAAITPQLPSLAEGISRDAVSIVNSSGQRTVPEKLDQIKQEIKQRGELQERALNRAVRQLEVGFANFNLGVAN